MKITRLILMVCVLFYVFGCSAKEEPVFCLSDDYDIASKTPVLLLSDTKFSKTSEGTALFVLSISDSLLVTDWDLVDLTIVNTPKGDTLVNYSSFQDNSMTKDFGAYRQDIDTYVKHLKVTLKEGIQHASTKKVQITVKVQRKE
jgi:hypothetical protein